MKSVWDVTVRDGLGFVFVFSYEANTAQGAKEVFKQRARRAGIKKFRNIKILKVEQVK